MFGKTGLQMLLTQLGVDVDPFVINAMIEHARRVLSQDLPQFARAAADKLNRLEERQIRIEILLRAVLASQLDGGAVAVDSMLNHALNELNTGGTNGDYTNAATK